MSSYRTATKTFSRVMVSTRTSATVVFAVFAVLATPLAAQSPQLGPADGRDLPSVDTGRVKVGDAAPEFTLESLAGSTVTLSQFRGKRNVILQFYRGHW